MKILVMSDSHGDTDSMLLAIRRTIPELILHLGDHDDDCDLTRAMFPQIPIRSVRGNCDAWSNNQDEEIFSLDGKLLFMTHGHLYGVKTGTETIVGAAKAKGADVLLFGHTHIPCYETADGIVLINPGAIGRGRDRNAKTYAVLELKNGAVTCEIKSIDES